MADFRDDPSIDQLRQRPAIRALESRFGGPAVVDALRAGAAAVRTSIAGGDASLADRRGDRRDASSRSPRRSLDAAVRAVAAAGDQRDRRRSSTRISAARRWPTPAVERVAAVARGYSTLEYDIGARRARAARRARRGAALPAHRRRSGGRRQQQRRGDDARARGAGGGTRGDRVARRAGRDRRRLSRAGRDGAVGRDAARSRHDQPDARRRLRGGDRRADGAHPARAPVELPHRGLHRAARRSASSSALGTRGSTCRSWRISGSGYLWLAHDADRRDCRRRRCAGRAVQSRPASPPASTSAASAATSSSAARRPASSSDARRVVERIARHPLMRALRVDKMTYAALEATLGRIAAGRAATTVPVQRMLAMTAEEIRARAADALSRTGVDGAGGGVRRLAAGRCRRSAAAARQESSCRRGSSRSSETDLTADSARAAAAPAEAADHRAHRARIACCSTCGRSLPRSRMRADSRLGCFGYP